MMFAAQNAREGNEFSGIGVVGAGADAVGASVFFEIRKTSFRDQVFLVLDIE